MVNQSVPILSENLTTIAEVVLPSSLLPDNSQQEVQFFVAPVPDSNVSDVGGFDVKSNTSFAANIFSSLISLTLVGNSSDSNASFIIDKFTDPVYITFFNTLPPNTVRKQY